MFRAFTALHPTASPLRRTAIRNFASAQLPGVLRLASGQRFIGRSFGSPHPTTGECVFSTSLVGYPESMTDPSYRGQILVFTQPLVGNYGVPAPTRDRWGLLEKFESEHIHVSAIVVANAAEKYSHWQAVESLGDWCKRNGIPALTGVDTRAVTRLLRDQGSTLGEIVLGKEAEDVWKAPEATQADIQDPNARNLVAEVSTKTPRVINPDGDIHVAVVDCGAKYNILRSLATKGARITLVPWDFDLTPLADRLDGVFITNGPGDPRQCTRTIDNLRRLLPKFHRPVFGICMGNQLLGLAAGMEAKKLPFGNRGHNQPVLNLQTGVCVITSQNHGYALDDTVMPPGWQRYFVNANDGSNEGIRHENGLWRSVQFHPEAKGGPMDTMGLFGEFLEQVRAEKRRRDAVGWWAEKSKVNERVRSLAREAVKP